MTAFFASPGAADVLTASNAAWGSVAAAFSVSGDSEAGGFSLSFSGMRSLLHLLFGETVHRRSRDLKYRAVKVELSAMMHFVLDHGPQPLADAQLRAARRHARSLEILAGEGAKDLHRLLVHALHVTDHGVVAVRELAAVAGIPARPQLRVLGEHPPLDRREVAHDVAERKLPLAERPVDPLRRHDGDDAHRALADAIEVADQFIHAARVRARRYTFHNTVVTSSSMPTIGTR